MSEAYLLQPRLQELTYDPNTDTIEVVRFNEKSAQNDDMNTYKYEYLLFEPFSQKYTKVVQVSLDLSFSPRLQNSLILLLRVSYPL